MPAHRNWSPDEDAELRRRCALGQTAAEIARAFGCTRKAVASRASRLSLEWNLAMKWTPEQDAVIARLWAEGRSGGEIGRVFQCSRNAAIGRLTRLGLSRGSPLGGAPRTGRPRARPKPKPRAAAAALRPPKPEPSTAVPLTPAVAAAPQILKTDAFSVPTPTARPMVSRQRGECAWPFDGRGGLALSCCARTGDDDPFGYCKPHRDLATPAAQPARQARRRAA